MKTQTDREGEAIDYMSSTGSCMAYSIAAPYKFEDNKAHNEDAYLICEPFKGCTVLAVADGAGGYQGGKMASSLAISLLRTYLESADPSAGSCRNQILDAIEACNAQLICRGEGATTIAVVEIQGSVIRPYHVGDSSIMVVGQRGLSKFQSISHSPVGFGIESGYIEADSAHQHDDRHWVSNLVGQKEMRIEVGAAFEMSQYDTLLVCSDGLTDNLSVFEIIESSRKGPLDYAMDVLANSAATAMLQTQGHPDDLTVLLYRKAAPKRQYSAF